MEDVFHLCLDHAPFLFLSRTEKKADGSTTGKFRKEIIKVGQYYKASDDLHFEITDQTFAHWIAQFAEMKKNGIKIPVPMGHSESDDNNRGWVTDLFVDGDALVMTCELSDRDLHSLVKRNDVSVYSPPEWTDTKGRKYVRPIRHIALTPVPVIPGLDEFRPIAASFGKETTMAVDLKKLGADIGITEDLTDDNAAALILGHCTTLKEVADKAATKAEAAVKEVETLKAATGKPAPEPDSTLLLLAHDNRQMKLDALVSAGKITPAVRDKLSEAFIGADNQALKLSLQTRTADTFDDVVKALAENDPVKLGEQTKAQTLELSDPNAGKDADVLLKDADRRAEAVKGQPGWRT